MQARWNGAVLAESDRTVQVGQNHYFPPESIRRELFHPARRHTLCPWRGIASCYSITVNGMTYDTAAWSYPHPWFFGRKLKNYVGFYPGVKMVRAPSRPGS